ncbi:MAG: bifunctional folylpolyglutamate synthase/dihydrofolate synthase [Alphaproteobacteria bacterium]|jgi:dihydrofolate synthase/folylpolyglutamate synthase|nr:bifunctional folylpolyglutamate synthase/dihydrofolate synthase [Alphaproteobacteria bacterium]
MIKDNNFTSKHLNFVDLSLSRIRYFLDKIGNPQDKINNIIHVAGTNGKGSTCAFLRAILEGHGFSVNVFTSPHLVCYNERFRIHGQLISDEYLKEVKQKIEQIEGNDNLTIFELTMVMGFIAFLENKADFTIIEVGLGGRLDASNVIKNPLLSVITTIDYDHQSFLGNTLGQIAYEKAGIIKHNSLTITDYQDSEVARSLKKYAKNMNSNIICGGEDYKIDFIEGEQPVLTYQDKKIILPKLKLLGQHQYYNVSMAIVSCINILQDKFNYDNLPKFLDKVQWQGRLQKVSSLYGVNFDNSEVYLDGAHNVSGSRALCNFIDDNYDKDVVVHIFLGMLVRKDLDGFLQNIVKLTSKFKIIIYPVEVPNHDSYSNEDILNKLAEYNLNGEAYNDMGKKLAEINNKDGKKLIIICGSLYLLGKILEDNIGIK